MISHFLKLVDRAIDKSHRPQAWFVGASIGLRREGELGDGPNPVMMEDTLEARVTGFEGLYHC